jgi:uncharacterized glyoxalase superfamily protein PhnB
MAETTGTNRAIPMISYENVATAADWLSGAFGFGQRPESRHTDDDGTVTHAELELDGALVMLGHPGRDYRSPRGHAEVCEQARKWLEPPYVVDGVLVYVDGLDEHHERARTNGATILLPPTTAPYGRYYTAADREGHRWMFMASGEK